MEPTFEQAGPAEAGVILAFMEAFYAHEHLDFDPRAAQAALEGLLADGMFGQVHLIRSGEAVAGYLVLTFGYSLEFGGRDAFVDELFLAEPYRGQGLGTAALRHAEAVCRQAGIRALHLEVERANTRAQAVYRKAGFLDHDRYLLTRRLTAIS